MHMLLKILLQGFKTLFFINLFSMCFKSKSAIHYIPHLNANHCYSKANYVKTKIAVPNNEHLRKLTAAQSPSRKNARLLRVCVRHRRRVGMLNATHHQDESTRGVRMSRRNRSAQHNREDARGP